MRITIITPGTYGEARPYVSLGVGLQAAGHEVRLVTNANYEPLVRQWGLDFAPLSGDPRRLLEDDVGQAMLEAGSNPVSFLRRYTHLAKILMGDLFADCWRVCQGAQAIVVSIGGFFAGGYHVAEKLGVPFCCAFLQPVNPTRAFGSLLLPAWPRWLGWGQAVYNVLTHVSVIELTWQLLRPTINKCRQEILGLPPLSVLGPFLQMHRARHLVLYGYSPSLIPRPPDWDDWIEVTGYWFLNSAQDSQLPAGLVNFLAGGPPPVYIGFGSMSNRDPKATTRLVLKALARAGQRGILATGWGGLHDTELPDEVFTVASVPHDLLFPRVAAVVHHGGLGTTAAGLRAGVPSIIVPFFADQPFWGRRVYELGVGPRPIPRKRLTTESLADAITAAVEDREMQHRAWTLGQRIQAEDGVSRAVEVFQQHFCNG